MSSWVSGYRGRPGSFSSSAHVRRPTVQATLAPPPTTTTGTPLPSTIHTTISPEAGETVAPFDVDAVENGRQLYEWMLSKLPSFNETSIDDVGFENATDSWGVEVLGNGTPTAVVAAADGVLRNLTSQLWEWNSTTTLTSHNASDVDGMMGATDVEEVDESGAGGAAADLVFVVAMSCLLGGLILVTVIGNVFVIAAIVLERHLQTAQNYLIVSLAVADLLVACLVMPLGAVYEISREWILGPELCDMWTSSDVLCCAASILHLLAIAADRYFAVTNVNYMHTRSERQIGIMIAMVWGVAVIVSVAPILGWKDPEFKDRVIVQKKCLVSQDIGYQIFATMATFYIPLLIILLLYWQIYQAARNRIRRRLATVSTSRLVSTGPSATVATVVPARHEADSGASSHAVEEANSGGNHQLHPNQHQLQQPNLLETEFTTDSLSNCSPQRPQHHQRNGTPPQAALEEMQISPLRVAVVPRVPRRRDSGKLIRQRRDEKSAAAAAKSKNKSKSRAKSKDKDDHGGGGVVVVGASKRESLEAKRERKAAKTLAIVTGAFVVCWLPFFIVALALPTCGFQGGWCSFLGGDVIFAVCLWLGYFNSTLNPIIYTIFSPDFRAAFKKILCGLQAARRRTAGAGLLPPMAHHRRRS